MKWVIASCLAVALGCVLALAADPPRKVKPVVVWSGIDSGQSKPVFCRCRSADEWQATWKAHQHEGGDAGRAAPEVDFESFMVLALFQGDGSQNYGLVVVEIVDEADGLRVRYETGYYQIAGIPDSEADRRKLDTRSFAFIVIPRSDKAITFESGTRQRTNLPPGDWKQVGTVPAVGRK
jgi:hypothetical protein